MDQVDLPETGVVTREVRDAAHDAQHRPRAPIVMADSRRGLGDFPPLIFKMNAAELARLDGGARDPEDAARALSARTGRLVFISMAERGIVAATPGGESIPVPAHLVRGPIDVVGAGDAVSANLAAALSAGADPREAMTLAMAAASVVIHQLGTTGTASVEQLAAALDLQF